MASGRGGGTGGRRCIVSPSRRADAACAEAGCYPAAASGSGATDRARRHFQQEALAFSTNDGYSLDVFVVGWHDEVTLS